MSLPLTTTQDTVLTALVDGLLLLPALADVLVLSAPVSLDESERDHCVVVNIPNGDESWYGLGNQRRQEDYDIDMAAMVWRDGADEAAIRAARTAAYAILNAVAGYVRDNPHLGGVTIQQLSGARLDQGYQDRRRWAGLRWTIRVRAHIAVA